MTSHTFVVLALLTVRGPVNTEAPQVPVFAEDVMVVTEELGALLPSELVAARVREVLHDHRDSEAWKRLASALPALAFEGGADLSSSIEAAWLADSIYAVSVEPVVREPTSERGATRVPWLGAWLDSPFNRRLTASASLALILAGVVGWTFKRRTDPQSHGRRVKTSEASLESRGRVVKTLAKNGQPVHEIARQTRMAQDGILLLLAIQSKGKPQTAADRGAPEPFAARRTKWRKTGSADIRSQSALESAAIYTGNAHSSTGVEI